MNQKTSNIITLEEFKEKHYGKIGTPQRDKLEEGYENFKQSAFLQEAGISERESDAGTL
jgi:hypothetical protein